MDTSRFNNDGDGFPLLDLTAKFAFKTSSSISFVIGRIENIRPDGTPDFVVSAFVEIGWIDVHHPCDSRVRVQIRIATPSNYHGFGCVEEMVGTICDVLSISRDETCEATVFSCDQVTAILPKVYFGMG